MVVSTNKEKIAKRAKLGYSEAETRIKRDKANKPNRARRVEWEAAE